MDKYPRDPKCPTTASQVDRDLGSQPGHARVIFLISINQAKKHSCPKQTINKIHFLFSFDICVLFLFCDTVFVLYFASRFFDTEPCDSLHIMSHNISYETFMTSVKKGSA
jgi:hypothetical protein